MGTVNPPGATRADAFRIPPANIMIAGLDTKIDADDPLWVPRSRLDALADASMEDSIFEIGVTQPVPLVKRGEQYFAVVGRRRTFNARAAALRSGANEYATNVRVFIVPKTLTSKDLARWIQAENAQRKDDSPMDRARGALRLKETFGCSLEEVAADCHVTTAAVRKWFKALEASEDVREAADAGRISMTTAAALAKAGDRAAQTAELVALLSGEAKPTAARAVAAAATSRARTKDATAETVHATVGRRTLGKILQHNDELKLLKPEHAEMLRWFRNELADSKIAGMTRLRKLAEGGE